MWCWWEYENCKCRKKWVDKLVEECTETDDEVKLAKITLAKDENKHKNKYSSCTLYTVLFSITFTINVGIGTYLVYYKYMNHDKKLLLKKDSIFQTTITKYNSIKLIN